MAGRPDIFGFLGGTVVSPVPAQAKACGYQILPDNFSVNSIPVV
jgi:hypothetical protein